MGAAASTGSSSVPIEQQISDTLQLFVNYDANAVVSQEDVDFAKICWEYITKDTSPEFLRRKAEDPPLETSSCLSWFYDCFYELSHSMDTESRNLYKDNLRVQVRALVAMVQTVLSIFEGLGKLLIFSHATE